MSSSSSQSLNSKRSKSSSIPIPIPIRTHFSPELDDRREVEKLENETRLYEWRATCMYHRLVNGMIRRGLPVLRSENVAMTTRRRPIRDDDGTDATLGSSTSSDDWFLDDSYETKQYQGYHHPQGYHHCHHHQPPSITQARDLTSIIGHQATRSCPSLSNINDIVEGHHDDDDDDDDADDGIMFDMEL